MLRGWTHLAQYEDHWWALVKLEMTILGKENIKQSFRLRYIRYYPVFMKLKLRTGQRNMLVFALTARWL